MQNHSYENDFDLYENETACRTHFHMKGFALRLVLKQRHKRTRKWPIALANHNGHNRANEPIMYRVVTDVKVSFGFTSDRKTKWRECPGARARVF